MEKISIVDGDWECLCGNTPISDGFYPCNNDGGEVEPTPEEWNGVTYVCARCGRIINQNTGEVIGLRVEHTETDAQL